MATVLVTAFEPFGRWTQNSSQLCLAQLERQPPAAATVTRLYPVAFGEVRQRLEADVNPEVDLAIHLGQAAAASGIRLEAVGLNVGAEPDSTGHALIEPGGPTAYRTDLPLDDWADALILSGLPASVSYHAGTYLCNATLYWSLHFAETRRLKAKSVFLHLPFAPEQNETPAMRAEDTARAVRTLVDLFCSPGAPGTGGGAAAG